MTVQQEKFKVLLIGDACLDTYIFVKETRKNPESNAPLLTEVDKLIAGGMARNVFKCLTNLGIEVIPVLPSALCDKIRVIDVDSGVNYFRIDRDINPGTIDLNKIPVKESFDAVVISDYNKGFIQDYVIKFIENNFNCPIFLDTKKTNLNDFSKCIIKVNTLEASQAETIPDTAIITAGGQGASTNDFSLSAMRVNCIDVVGAGDAFLAGLVYGYLYNNDKNSGIMFGIVNSGISVSRYGTYAPTLQELREGLKEYAKYCGEN